MIETTELFPGVRLHFIRDPRFKQSLMTVQFLRPMCREESAKNALWSSVLLRGSRNYPDLRDITIRLDSLYGAGMGAMVRRVGDVQASGMSMTFLADRFALAGDAIFRPMAEFVGELLLEPRLDQGVFRQDYVEGEKKNLISAIESRRNDKAVYAMQQLLARMCREDPYGLSRLGEPEDIANLTAAELYDYYVRVLKESPVEIFCVGDLDADTVAAGLMPLAEALGPRKGYAPGKIRFHDAGGGTWAEQQPLTQTQLDLGFVSDVTLDHPLCISMRLFNLIYGAGMQNKLFRVIRETMSLCYDISSAYHAGKGLLTVSTGIENAQTDRVREEIFHQLTLCQQGNITAEELNSAREAMHSSLRATFDSGSNMEGYYFNGLLTDSLLPPEEYHARLDAVTLEEVVEAANHVRFHSEFLLRGVKG